MVHPVCGIVSYTLASDLVYVGRHFSSHVCHTVNTHELSSTAIAYRQIAQFIYNISGISEEAGGPPVINLNVTVFTRRQCAPDVTCDYEFAIFSVDNQFLVDNFQNFSSRVSDTRGRSHYSSCPHRSPC